MLKFIISLFMSLNLFGYHPFQSEQVQAKQVKQVTSQQAEQKQQTQNENEQQTVGKQQNDTTEILPNLQLAVISDTHISATIQSNGKKFQTALKDLNNVAPNYDVLAVNGDLTDDGFPVEYDLFNSILNANMNQNASKFLVMGNHEWKEKKKDSPSNITDRQLMERFMSKENVPGLYYDEWIKGYHFIALAGEKSAATLSASSDTNTDGAYISDKQIKWLEATLADGAGNGKPIFVFLHQPIRGTVYGSEWGAGYQDQKILAILKKYPQVILFTGHSHYPLNNAKSIIHDGITMVNTSSVAYTYTPETGANDNQSQGLIVNVYNDKVEFKAREFDTGSWIKTVTIPITSSNQLQN
jgi:3',5'-cyclic AMP phosphodiesterase CpdA